MKAKDIHPVFHYVPLHSAPMGRKVGRTVGTLTNTTDLSDRLVRLPLWLGLEEHLPSVISEAIAGAGA